MTQYMTYDEISKALNIKVNTLYALVHQRRIPHIRIGRRMVRFDRAEIEAWIHAQRIDIDHARES